MIAISHTTDPADIPWLCQQLRATYWGQWLNDEQIRKALDRSICVWAHSIDGAHGTPVGFMRVVTDGAIFSSITDCFVVREWQRQGIGSKLLARALSHPEIAPTICILATRDAEKFYERFNFRRQLHGVMKRDPA